MKESLAWEIIEAVKDYYDGTDEGEELVVAICNYLYRTSTDDKMQEGCMKVLTDLNYCVTCGNKLQSYHYKEYHEEVDAYETMFSLLCPLCDRDEIMEMK